MTKKRYWRGIEEKENHPKLAETQNSEFSEKLPGFSSFPQKADALHSNRRDFLKMFGFSVTAATVAASCEMPVKKSIPYLIKPDEIVPGEPNFYASAYTDGGDFCSVLVKTREGRPIKIEGNKLSGITKGGTSAIVQASVLSLYDNYRLKGPAIKGEPTTWEAIDDAIIAKLEEINVKGGKIRILSSSIISPSTKKAIEEFKGKYPTTQHVTYDPISYSGLLDAAEKSFGKRVIPNYQFDKADLIVGMGADFLGTWISPVEYATRYGSRRKVSTRNKNMSRHIQVESYLSLTGSNADTRIVVRPSEEGVALLHLYNVIASKTGAPVTSNLPELDPAIKNGLAKVGDELINNKGRSLVVCGSNDVNEQLMTFAINDLLGNIGKTVDLNNFSNQKQGNDQAVNDLVNELGNIDAVIFFDSNPAYNHPRSEEIRTALEKVDLSVSLNWDNNETTNLCNFSCPDHHYLESWNDAEPKKGHYAIVQPTIAPLFHTRSAAESLLKWSGNGISYYDYIRNYWNDSIYPQQSKYVAFNVLWDNTVHNGTLELTDDIGGAVATPVNVNAAGAAILKNAKSNGIDIVLYEKTGIRDGKYAGNPWLQELPDPVSKVTWDNYAAVSMKFAEDHNLEMALGRMLKSVGTETEMITVKANGYSIDLPVVVQPGTPENTIAIALGYGRKVASKAGEDVGRNAYPFIQYSNGYYDRSLTGATIEIVAGEEYPIAQTQTHHTINDGLNERKIVKETTLEEYLLNPEAGNEDRKEIKEHLKTLYGYHENLKEGHHWEMSVDLNSCIGCGACVIACTAENNVPVVGKDEVRRSREMHWLRIDRYYSGLNDNPSVIFQPLMCQHCDNAPCENVCPVSATNHSSEGINQMAYNRCIGTRYCENNCPYKVRRFNWFDYLGADSFKKGTIFDNDRDPHQMSEELTRMVLNPDVAVRSRGVMEKCTFCVQRIQAGKLKAKKEERLLNDEDIATACQDACPTNAINFGDINSATSALQEMALDKRGYKVIEEIHTLPSVTYLTKVRNTAKSEA